MSMSDSDTSSQGSEYKNFRQISRDRLLYEMLRSAKTGDSKSSWKVLIMDKVTVKIMSYACKMADITEEGVSSLLSSSLICLADHPCTESMSKAFVFFSSPVARELVSHIKRDGSVLSRIGALREGFVTDNERALEELFGDEESSRRGDACLNLMATRIATVFSSLRIAPIIHEWTYDAMCHDLLNMEGNKYVHEVPSKTGGVPEKKEVLLEDHDPIWLELRHAHIADASERLHQKMTNFVSKNKAAQIHGSRDGGELSTRDLQKMVQALPQYSEQIEKLSLHVDIAGKINKIIRESGLKEVGQLEQDLVFGDAGTKDLINFLRVKEMYGKMDHRWQDVSRENKLRLLMIYAAVYPEKFEDDKISKLMEKKHAARKDRPGEEVTWQLSRFYPIIEELVEKLSKGELPKKDYPCMNDPSPTFHGTSQAASVRATQVSAPHSMRSRRTATWARPRNSDDGYSSDSILRHASSDFKKMGQRIFVFIVGGATRSELRVCHKLSTKLQREIVLGSSSLDDPPQFITKLKLMTADELSLDDLQI
ncbi:hypothetical protein DH2020_047285 [Rehmannia glutinosa]|uniref:Uncharacterized protein n=1 Tax=Rehmannia glutinosa TaxID=99300 RepID=A0ABR0U923_REHGL